MSAEMPKMREDFSAWWRSLTQDQRYDFDSEGRGYKKPPEVLMWAAWQEAARQAMEKCAEVCDVTPPYPFRPSIEAAHAIRVMKEKQ